MSQGMVFKGLNCHHEMYYFRKKILYNKTPRDATVSMGKCNPGLPFLSNRCGEPRFDSKFELVALKWVPRWH